MKDALKISKDKRAEKSLEEVLQEVCVLQLNPHTPNQPLTTIVIHICTSVLYIVVVVILFTLGEPLVNKITTTTTTTTTTMYSAGMHTDVYYKSD